MSRLDPFVLFDPFVLLVVKRAKDAFEVSTKCHELREEAAGLEAVDALPGHSILIKGVSK